MKAELVPINGDAPIPITKDVTIVDACTPTATSGWTTPASRSGTACSVKTDGLLVVRDLASTNGTKVKGQKVRWAALLPHDRIAFGTYKFRVYLGPDDAPGPSELARWGDDEASPRLGVAATTPEVAEAAGVAQGVVEAGADRTIDDREPEDPGFEDRTRIGWSGSMTWVIDLE
jgi:hypothetical protein